MKKIIKAVSLFASAGVGELYLKDIGVDVIVANELNQKRCELYQYFHPNSCMICGDITDEKTKQQISAKIADDVDLLIATPPCQGLSTLGRNKIQADFINDKRNFLIFEVFDLIDKHHFNYILIENVPKFLDMYFPYNNDFLKLEEILKDKYSNKYDILISVLDAKDYGVPQTRKRAIIKLVKKGLTWKAPIKKDTISLRDAIGHLPSLESGESSAINYHSVPVINERYVNALKNTPTGKSALENLVHYPKTKEGIKIKGFHNTFKRMSWDEPAPTRTTYCGNVNSHNNVHPGRDLGNGQYSDARPLTLLETLIVSSIDSSIKIPENISLNFMYTIIGEGIPPLMLREIILPLIKQNDVQNGK